MTERRRRAPLRRGAGAGIQRVNDGDLVVDVKAQLIVVLGLFRGRRRFVLGSGAAGGVGLADVVHGRFRRIGRCVGLRRVGLRRVGLGSAAAGKQADADRKTQDHAQDSFHFSSS